MSNEMISELPALRVHAILALTKVLHYIKLRSLCHGDANRILLQKTNNPLKQMVKLQQPLDTKYTTQFIASLKEPMQAGTTHLVDKQYTGWLVWGEEMEAYLAPGQTGNQLNWEAESDPGLQAIREIVLQRTWWQKVADHLSREQSRDYLAAENTALVKSIFQIVCSIFCNNWGCADGIIQFRSDACEPSFAVIDLLLQSEKDRHKIRAACELIAGMVRGSKHWSMDQQSVLWTWLSERMPALLEHSLVPDTQ